MPVKKWFILLVLFVNFSESGDRLAFEDKGHECCSISVAVYDGIKKFDFSVEKSGTLIVKKGLLSTTAGRKYLVVLYKNGFIPAYALKTYDGKDISIETSKLKKFSKEKSKMSYISGTVARASIGGKIKFRSGLSRLESGHKIHIFELDKNGMSKRDFYITTDKNGYFGTYVNPGKYRVEYGKREEFQLSPGENGIFLMSIKTMRD